MPSSTLRPMTSTMFAGLVPSTRISPVDCAECRRLVTTDSRSEPVPNCWL
jgi:hypothetical protein